MQQDFVAGLTLSRLFYEQVVEPLLRDLLPGLSYSAALIGYGSEVQGFDTARSTDHAWGPRLQVRASWGPCSREPWRRPTGASVSAG